MQPRAVVHADLRRRRPPLAGHGRSGEVGLGVLLGRVLQETAVQDLGLVTSRSERPVELLA
ncbi:MAG: hypothetical protein KY462_08645 [Actinobacteria bacterium]|nr:hypothetical protein [Actinomycetota bacterium]